MSSPCLFGIPFTYRKFYIVKGLFTGCVMENDSYVTADGRGHGVASL